MAEKYLYNEFSIVLDMNYEETKKYVLKEGDIVKGIVTNIKPYGAFIEIEGGITGLLHIEDISVARIKSPRERIRVGQKTNVMVKSIDKNQDKIRASIKKLRWFSANDAI